MGLHLNTLTPALCFYDMLPIKRGTLLELKYKALFYKRVISGEMFLVINVQSYLMVFKVLQCVLLRGSCLSAPEFGVLLC